MSLKAYKLIEAPGKPVFETNELIEYLFDEIDRMYINQEEGDEFFVWIKKPELKLLEELYEEYLEDYEDGDEEEEDDDDDDDEEYDEDEDEEYDDEEDDEEYDDEDEEEPEFTDREFKETRKILDWMKKELVDKDHVQYLFK